MRKFKLLKDTVGSKAGIEFRADNHNIFYTSEFSEESYLLKQVEGNPEWFEEIKNFNWTWENCFDDKGYCIDLDSKINVYAKLHKINENRNIFKTEKQTKQALAFAQLTHIVAKANGEWNVNNARDSFYRICYDSVRKDLYVHIRDEKDIVLNFFSENIAIEVLSDNLDLIYQYFGVGKK